MNENHKKKNKTNKKARRKLKYVLEYQNYKCYYCKRDLIYVKELNKNPNATNVKVHKQRLVRWIENGIKYEGLMATAEHLKRVSEGGESDLFNVVASCADCNAQKNREALPTKSRFCKSCGLLKESSAKSFKHCNKCRLWNKNTGLMLYKQLPNYLKHGGDYY